MSKHAKCKDRYFSHFDFMKSNSCIEVGMALLTKYTVVDHSRLLS
jgi:hypothetical protein